MIGDKLYSTDLFQNMMQTSEEVKMPLVQFITVNNTVLDDGITKAEGITI